MAPGSTIPCSQEATTERVASPRITWSLCADHAAQWDDRVAARSAGATSAMTGDVNVVMVGDRYVSADYPVRLCKTLAKAKRFTKVETIGVCKRALGLPMWNATSPGLPATAKQIRVVPVNP